MGYALSTGPRRQRRHGNDWWQRLRV